MMDNDQTTLSSKPTSLKEVAVLALDSAIEIEKMMAGRSESADVLEKFSAALRENAGAAETRGAKLLYNPMAAEVYGRAIRGAGASPATTYEDLSREIEKFAVVAAQGRSDEDLSKLKKFCLSLHSALVSEAMTKIRNRADTKTRGSRYAALC